jgi:hypothetical protein
MPPPAKKHRSPEPLMRRLDRVAGLINPILVVVVMALVILNVTCLAALTAANLPVSRASPTCVVAASPAMGTAAR